jgi:thiol:disulfide interchange protein DsbD
LATPAWAQGDNAATFGPIGGQNQNDAVVTIESQFSTATAQAPAMLWVTAKMKPGWHIYSITQAPGGPVASKIALKPSNDYRLMGEFQPSPPPEKKAAPEFGGLIVESHYDTVVWSAPIELSPSIDPGQLRIEGSVRFQPCQGGGCLMPQTANFSAAQGPGAAPAAATTVPAAAPTGSPAFDPKAVAATQASQQKDTSLLEALVMGFLGGLILNLMPCVLPVIGLKIFSFMEQAGHSRGRALVLNVWYSLGLLAVFAVLASLAAFLGMGWGQLFGYAGFNITLAAIVFAMALSFLGVWEVPIPGFIGTGKADELAQREGAGGAFAKGVLTTILATPCSAPFLGTALAWAVAQPVAIIYSVFLAVGLGMATPYLLIGAFPELIRFLPKPGAWMETVKQLMGFVLLGTVVFVLTVIDGPYVVPTIGLLFGVWMACWWIGRTSLTAELGVKVRSWLSAAAIVGITFIITFGWLAGIMEARYSKSYASVLPWKPFNQASFEEMVASGNTILVDFTADWCLTCKTLEATNLNTDKVRELVEANRVVTLKADWTYNDPEVTRMLELLGSKQVPVIAVFPAGDPNKPIALIGGYTQKMVLDALQKAGPSRPPVEDRNGMVRAAFTR